MNEIVLIKNALKCEKDAIAQLEDKIDDQHKLVIDICKECTGKIIFVGIGKSGHVARKISSTFASLGTPSFFLHPAEAAHGDLGMVEEKDVVILISKSGDTDELIQLIPSLKIIGCKIIGIFCTASSILEKYCDVTVVLPVEREACINDLAPTTSTTLTMAFGDALAVTLSAIKGFGKNDFALFHPKGSLGKQLLLTIDLIANKDISKIGVRENDEIKSILWVITKNRLGAVVVLDDDNHMLGLVSDGDIRRAIETNESIMNIKAYEIMTRNPVFANEGMLAVDALMLMQSKKISVLPIINNENRIIGVVSIYDIMEAGITGVKR